MLAHLFFAHGRGKQFFALRRINAIKTGPRRGRRCDAEMHLFGARIEDHFLDLAAGRAAHNAVIDQDDPFAFDQGAVDVELEAHTHVADLLGRFDEGAAHVLVADDPHAVRDAAFARIANRGWRAAVRHGADQIGLNRAFLGQLRANLPSRVS